MRIVRIMVVGLAVMVAANAAQAEARCGLGAAGSTVTVRVGDTGRDLLLHMPAKARSGRPAPLVVLLHGSTGSDAGMLDRSGLAATADRHGFIIAAPNGGIAAAPGHVWNIPGVPTVTGKVPGPGDPDDVAFIGTAIDWLAAQGCIDRSRVYATGLSGGGRMASWLACVAADRFAAIAPVVGLRAGNPLASDPARPDPATCRPSRPVPVIAFAGETDTTNPVGGGGAGYWQYPMAAALARWAELNGCRTGPTRETVSSTISETAYDDCREKAVVVGRIAAGRGHEWVADNEAMWAFFRRFRR